jgi:hypothetical protein
MTWQYMTQSNLSSEVLVGTNCRMTSGVFAADAMKLELKAIGPLLKKTPDPTSEGERPKARLLIAALEST